MMHILCAQVMQQSALLQRAPAPEGVAAAVRGSDGSGSSAGLAGGDGVAAAAGIPNWAASKVGFLPSFGFALAWRVSACFMLTMHCCNLKNNCMQFVLTGAPKQLHAPQSGCWAC